MAWCAFAWLGVTVGGAQAAWSPVARLRDATSPQSVGVAADARGDAAVAWIVSRGAVARSMRTAVWVAVRRGRSGAWVEHLLRSGRGLRAGGFQPVALVVSPTGEVTVAWIDQLAGQAPTVRAAYLRPRSRWTAVQTVGAGRPYSTAYLRLAVASDGTVVLAYDAGTRAAPGMAAAWRRPGHRFGSLAAVPGGQLSQPALAIDAAGTTFLAGTALCNNESLSHGVVLTAPAATHRFSRPRSITPHPATEVRFVLTGTGQGIASWLGAGCSTSELLSGAVSAARVSSSRAGAPSLVDPRPGNDLQLFAAPGGVDLSWASPTLGILFQSGVPLLAHGTAGGAFEQPHQPSDGWVPIGADVAGDQVLQTVQQQKLRNGAPEPRAISARPAGSATVAPSPIAGPALWTAAGSATGRTLIAATTGSGTAPFGPLRAATWTP